MAKKQAGKRRNRDQLKQDIIVAATELFAREGYSGPSIRDIAAHAEVALPALYRFFVNKHDLYVQCCRYALQKDLDHLVMLASLDALKDASPELVIYSTTLAVFARQSNREIPHIVSRAIFDGDAHMIYEDARGVFDSEFFKLTIKAAGELSDPEQAVHKLAFVHSLAFALKPILSFWEPFHQIKPIANSTEEVAVEVLNTIFPKVDWEKVAQSAPLLAKKEPTGKGE